ncbi:hypothetical protein LTSEINV_3130 [Salmonella enterica subsp. enterica serovar Inverness str. R8-3668]|uniref:Uncharacterized protein n=1 Tax=Salmonella enterica subsp. enterica serovar Inverness str. R8-3668 TaxID=913075 RepID=G5NEJ8_SALET|nr:hypothetical protein LTSEINV_3130 [Salmonella enterica subsp. enterica serovar Inverness str. R8-3668]
MAHKFLLDGVTQDGSDVLLDPHGNFKIAKRFCFFNRNKQVTCIQI